MNIRRWLLYKILREVKIYSVKFSQTVKNVFYDHMYDRKFGIETMDFVCYTDDLSANKDASWYEPTPYRKLERIFASIPMAQNDIFIDLGCGKGRVLLLVSTKKIEKAIGVELHSGLVNAAEENLKNLKVPHEPVEIIQIDCAQYKFSNETIIFMYNPFGSGTTVEVMNNIKNSLVENPRNVRIIYKNALHRDIFDSQDWLVPIEVPSDEGFLMWRTRR
jgi:cyclopropane fatty-acyl-phospholipid synthase-like methyltransferase